MGTQRIAVLVDGDNINAAHANEILSRAGKLGRVDVARVYAGLNPSCEWLKTPGYRLFHAGAGKNAADILLCIDAMELAMTGDLSTFVIATSDGDFSHLVLRQRERGLHVLGLGEAKAPECFRLACSEFATLEGGKLAAQPPTSRPAVRNCSVLDWNIRKMIASGSEAGQGIPIADLGRLMGQKHGTRIGDMPDKTWRAYLTSRAKLYDLDPRGPKAKVRFKPDGFAALPV
ncbi:Uncharacterized conserved protein, LabA/DUF88 family [Roseovarius nanhaiticus]|uniref:Uncharacterized conserved protein, LabA/DUF88 family n=1 Tax=Roseovarius nanhaiticus TaxID=573024 RepID=A0A1N7H603_9RHOB|nr:NYN domain-containing protein [Roseovarius nanhaiticus]SEL11508.1 Uncharacterized conserved protein, LabA/DUF88 family [Roseovarius nanhaiticus]SIS20296.1 Uncharacterized conserved protein, LabA/DUF88 family [Roseovarius nanhaiticus]